MRKRDPFTGACAPRGPPAARAGHALVGTAAALVLAALGARPAAAQGPRDVAKGRVQLKVRTGLLDQAYPGWIPIQVSIENDGPPVRARLEASVLRFDRPWFTASKTVDLLEGARRRETLYVLACEHASLSVAALEAARPEATPLARVEPSRFSVLRSWEYSSNKYVHVVDVRDERAGRAVARSALPKTRGSNADVVVSSSVEPRDLPDRAIGYASVDVLRLTEVDTSAIGETQRNALLEWLAGGGRVWLSPGAKASFFEDPLVRAILPPGTRARPLDVDRLPRIEAEAGHALPSREGTFRVYSVDRPGAPELQRLLVEPQGSDESVALFTFLRHGKGTILVGAADLDLPPFDRWAGTPVVLSKLVEQLRGSWLSDRNHEDPATRTDVAQALNAAETPSQLLVLAIVVLYILVVGPLNYAVLRKRELHVLIVATTPVLALLASGVVFASGYLVKGISSVVQRATFLEVALGETVATERAYVGLRSSGSATFRIELDPGLSGNQVFATEEAARGAHVEVEEDGGRFVFPRVPLNMWDHAFFEARGRRDLGGAVRIVRRGTDVSVENGTKLALGRGLVTTPEGAFLRVEPLAPGETRPAAPGPPGPHDLRALAGLLCDSEDESAFALRVLQHLPIERARRTTYVGRLAQAPSAIVIDGRDKSTRAVHLLIAHDAREVR